MSSRAAVQIVAGGSTAANQWLKKMNAKGWGLLLVATIYCLLIISAVAGSRRRQAAQGYRLPDNVEPQKYNLEILANLDPANFSFDGKVLIKMKCVKASNKIILHSKELDITEKEVTLKQITAANETVDVPITSHTYAKENDFYIIMLGQRLVQGATYRLYIPFRGKLDEGLVGFYRSSYIDKTNTTKWLAVTQFESTEARRAFPCFDEPALKATFSIAIGHTKNFKAISNMPLKESKPLKNKPDWVLDKFMETVPMSTYLVAFMVSEFEYKEAPKTNSNVTFRIWVRKTALNQAELAKEVGPKVLSYFETYFNTKYPLPKQDMAAIPDFNAGAMENWGLITYRETALLYDPKSSSIFNKQRVASVISHELAHQWFGNLVTMKWWTDLWLNEGFATYVGALGVHHVFPEWNSLDGTFVSDFMTVLSLDELKSSHPVSVPIGHPSEIEQIFDTISYKKGSYLIRMMNMFLGEDIFQKSVTNYLQKHKYGNAAQDDLWEALTETAHAQGVLQSNITVKMIMDTWTVQTGFPVVTVTRDYEKGTVTVTQERYVSAMESKNKKPRQTESPCWWVPLSYTDGKEMRFTDTKPEKWLTCDGPLTFTVDAAQDQWLVFNLKASGLYRVNYDEKNWMMLKDTLMDDAGFKNVDTLSRVQLISDMLSFAWNGQLDYGTVFSVMSYLKHENEHLPWRTALSGLGAVNQMLLRTPTFGYFKRVLREFLEPSYAKIGRITDLPTEYEAIKQHSLIVYWSCYFGVMDCEDQSSELFKAWYEGSNPDENNPIPNDLRSVVYCRALKHGGEKYWEFLWQRYEKSNVASEKQDILSALGCVNELWLLQRYLQWSLNSTKVRKQDSLSVFSSVASNEIGYLVAKSFFVRQFTNIRDYHDAKSSRLGSYIKILTNQMTTPEELNEFQNFTSSVSQYLKEAEISVKQGLEAASNNIHWHSMHFEKISDMFNRMK